MCQYCSQLDYRTFLFRVHNHADRPIKAKESRVLGHNVADNKTEKKLIEIAVNISAGLNLIRHCYVGINAALAVRDYRVSIQSVNKTVFSFSSTILRKGKELLKTFSFKTANIFGGCI